MRKLFERSVRMAVAMELVDLAVQAVDGTKVVTNASVNRGYDATVAHLPDELADKEVLRDRVRRAMSDLGSQRRYKRTNLTDPEARLLKGFAGHRGRLQRPGYGLTRGDCRGSGGHAGHSRGRG